LKYVDNYGMRFGELADKRHAEASIAGRDPAADR
jgi:hypothetical protein